MKIVIHTVLLVSTSAILCGAFRFPTGSSSSTSGPFTFGGDEAEPNKFPWIVNIRTGDGSFCGGSLIALDLVITAAHCVVDTSPESIQVTAGDYDLGLTEDTEQTETALDVKWHEDYDESTLENDIALIRLNAEFIQSSAVGPIQLPPPDFDITQSSSGIVAGWGTTSFGSSTSTILRKVSVAIRDLESCQLAYQSQVYISDKQFCAGDDSGGKDSCQGDPGGPFICDADDTVVCGIVSFGDNCALPGHPDYPGVYVKVSSYLDWINSYTSSSRSRLRSVVNQNTDNPSTDTSSSGNPSSDNPSSGSPTPENSSTGNPSTNPTTTPSTAAGFHNNLLQLLPVFLISLLTKAFCNF